MAGTSLIYTRVRDLTGLEDSYENLGGANVRVRTAPQNVSIDPIEIAAPAGTFQTVTAKYSDVDDNFKYAFLRFIRPDSAKVDFIYDAELDRFRVRATGGEQAIGNRGTSPGVILDTSLGAWDLDNTVITRENGILTIKFRILVKSTLGMRVDAYLHVIDLDGREDGYDNVGGAYWIIPNTAPENVSLTPTEAQSIAGTYRTFTATYRDVEQNIDIAAIRFVNPSGSVFEARLQPSYSDGQRKFYVRGITLGRSPGTPGATISTATGTLDVEQSSVVLNGSTLIINFRIALTGLMAGVNAAYLRVNDTVLGTIIQVRPNNARWTITNPSIFYVNRLSNAKEWEDLY